jgi:putative flavoprotein involved in K+ transport
MMTNTSLSYDTIVIGGSQAGLTTGYFLKQQGIDFVILDAGERVGDAWRQRWDSLRLFTPARFSELPGMRFPGPRHAYPTKDEMADYLEAYAARFELPVRTGARVQRLWRQDGCFVVEAGGQRYQARQVVVAMSSYQKPRIPEFAGQLDRGIVQLHSLAYRNPSQLQPGGVLVVGAGNSGAEIALDIVGKHPTWLSGRDTSHVPIRIERALALHVVIPVLFRLVFHRLLTLDTPVGRKVHAKLEGQGMPLVRVKPPDLAAAGVRRVPRTVGVRDGQPMQEDGRVLDVANVIWATGFEPSFDWIDLPVFEQRRPLHRRGVVASQPGLYFVGLSFLYAASSGQIHGVTRDAEHVVRAIAARSRQARAAGQRDAALELSPR